MIGIYKITNTLNNKVYIGQSRNIEQRWKAHRTRAFNKNTQEYDKPLYRSIRKHGLEVFSFEVVEECEINKLDEREIYWINHFQSTDRNNGYNISIGGNVVINAKLNKDQVKEIKDLIKNTQLSYGLIATKFNVSERTIRMINEGETWLEQGTVYPIRSHKIYEEKVCPFCGKKILKTSITCTACREKNNGNGCPISREELKSLIRTKTFVSIGKDFNVTDNAIKNWCKKLQLPSKKKIIKQYSDIEWEKI